MALIEIKNLTYSYDGASQPAIKNMNVSIEKNEYVAILGANASGKSTLLRCLNGLANVKSGTVSVSGYDPSKNKMDVRKILSVVFQSPEDQLVASIVEEDVAFGLENMAMPKSQMQVQVTEALSKVGLISERQKETRLLSAGQQQRLAIAGALAMKPVIIAFDEATSMLDPQGSDDILSLMDELHNDGVTILHVTHNMDEVARATRVLVLKQGQLVFDGSAAALFSSGQLEHFNLALPLSYKFALELGLEPILGETALALAHRAKAANKVFVQSPDSIKNINAAEIDNAFELIGAEISYVNELSPALTECNLQIKQGSITAIVGVTGSGKSSLLQLLPALVLPTKGRVISLGIDTHDKKANLRSLRMHATLSVQKPENAIFENYAADEVAFGLINKGFKGTELKTKVKNAMNIFGLNYETYANKISRSLSGGQKRCLALASIFALDPDAILLDEPTASLDPAARAQILSIILNHVKNSTRPITLVMATHSMEEASLADMVMVLNGGMVVAYDSTENIFTKKWNEAWELKLPFMYEFKKNFK